jgi:hypothetical protein
VVIAIAGRRIDALDASRARFPLANVAVVRRRIEDVFDRNSATMVVGSAACGADLLAMEAAGSRGMRRRVVLPFDPERFRTTSVTDRPGDWAAAYDRLLAELDRTGDVITLRELDKGDNAYATANHTILDEAGRLAGQQGEEPLTVLIWDGARRGDVDLTAALGDEARRRGWRVEHIPTL